jgi:hypothetical protein
LVRQYPFDGEGFAGASIIAQLFRAGKLHARIKGFSVAKNPLLIDRGQQNIFPLGETGWQKLMWPRPSPLLTASGEMLQG